MRYLREVASSCTRSGQVSTYLCQKNMKFCFSNLENGGEDTNGSR